MSETIGERFMRETSYDTEDHGPSDQQKGIPQPPLQAPYDPDGRLIVLPTPASLSVPALDMRAAIEDRRTYRTYADTPLSLDELTWLLWATQGVQKRGTGRTYRTVPSGGARHPFETYLIVRNVAGVAPGIWRYLALEHQLAAVELAKPDLMDEAVRACAGQEFVRECAVLFAWVCVPYRVTWRYAERGYRDMHIDAGHVGQNLYLASAPVGCGVCTILAFGDQAMCDLLGLDRSEQWVIYAASVGKRG
jgi:SagB-type dehydrogenase family enzyme